MKKHQSFRRAKGFTLIELLVVITIVAILAGLSFAGVNLAIKKARKTEALVMANSLASAVENFYGEYNRLPEGAGSEVKTDGSGLKFLQALLGQEGSGSDVQNTRGIIFLQGKEAKSGLGGIDYGTGDTLRGVFSPFRDSNTGKAVPYTVFLNTDYQDSLRVSWGSDTITLRGRQVAVACEGPDGLRGTADDIKTWNN